MKREQRDSIYADPQGHIADFVFDEKVAIVFEDMIKRSVPGYAAIINMIGILAERYVKPNTSCYDLGCSLGAATLAMRRRNQQPAVEFVAVDNSEAMIIKCRKNVEKDQSESPVEFICADIRDITVLNASMVVLNFTLQFIEPQEREALLSSIYQGMLPGSVLVISDKIAFNDPQEEKRQVELHHTFKKLNGYSNLEIAQKRTALENVLIPDTLETHHTRLKNIGFKNSSVWFQCFNFASIIAIK